MMEEQLLIVLASVLPVSGLVIVISVVVAAIVIVGIILLVRNGNKNKAAATGSGSDWQHQAQPGAWNQQGGWGQQGQWGPPNQAGQPGNWATGPQNPWGAPAQQQQAANQWGAPAQTQQAAASPWGAPAQQQAANQWGAPAEQANQWGAPAQQQQAAASPWGAPAQQQQAANQWGTPAQTQQAANQWGTPAQTQQAANQWEPASPAASQDPWGQQQAAASQQQAAAQAAASQQPAWGMQQASTSAPVQQGQQAPTAFGGATNSPATGWGTQQADPWGNQVQAASPIAQPNGFQPANSAGLLGWQQGNIGAQGGIGFAGNEPEKTILRQGPTPAPQQMGPIGYVQVKEGKEPGRIYEIRKESLSIGRSRESDIFLEDLAVSRLHASIVNMGNGNYALKDEGSANGTKVNDQLVDKFKTHPLKEGDQIQLGQTVLVFARH